MESISALVGGVYPQVDSRVLPRLKPGVGMTGAAADSTEGKARHARVTMKHFNLFKFSRAPIFDMEVSKHAILEITGVSNLYILIFRLGSARTTEVNGGHGLVRARGFEALASIQPARRKRADGI